MSVFAIQLFTSSAILVFFAQGFATTPSTKLLVAGRTLLGKSCALSMSLDSNLAAKYPRDFKTIPQGTDYGKGEDEVLNRAVESRRLQFLEDELLTTLTNAVNGRERPMFTTALIAGDNVILDALARAKLLDKVPIVFVDTYTLFPETLQHLEEVEKNYGFKAQVYHAADCASKTEYLSKYGEDYWQRDIEQYDMLCKVEPMNRALKEQNSDCWINGRRRDHGAERAALPVWEGKKVR